MFLIRKNSPEVTDAGLWIPFSVECPKGIDGMELRFACCLLQVVSEPTAMAALSLTSVIVGTQSPWTGIEYFVSVSVMDILVENVL